jgi:hypothetical protein
VNSSEAGGGLHPRIATPADLPGVTATLAAAFAEDPLCTWAFPDADKREAWWRFLLQRVLRYPCTWVAGDFEAVVARRRNGGQAPTPAASPKATPVSCSETSHSLPATAMSCADFVRPTSFAGPRCSIKPPGPAKLFPGTSAVAA